MWKLAAEGKTQKEDPIGNAQRSTICGYSGCVRLDLRPHSFPLLDNWSFASCGSYWYLYVPIMASNGSVRSVLHQCGCRLLPCFDYSPGYYQTDIVLSDLVGYFWKTPPVDFTQSY